VNFFRTMPTRRLVAGGAALVVVAAGGVAVAQADLSGGATPPPKPLAQAISDALAAPKPQDGVYARVAFTNTLIPGGTLATSTPLLSGASGRLWASAAGIKLELQNASGTGDTLISANRQRILVYDASRKAAYRFTLPADTTTETATPSHSPPTLTEIQAALTKLETHANVSAATPTSIAGQPAYQVRISPKHDGGLLGAAELAWDANHGVPLRIAIYATGSSSPVLELAVTDIQFGSVTASDVAVNVPAGTPITDIQSPKPAATATTTTPAPAVTGLAAVQAAVSFPVTAPDTLVGLPRQTVRLTGGTSDPAVLVVYGRGLGAILVVERAAKPASTTTTHADPFAQLPAVSINGATGNELPTALGTVIRVTHNGVETIIAGSIPTIAAENAARELVG
jgi:hypothetical protein